MYNLFMIKLKNLGLILLGIIVAIFGTFLLKERFVYQIYQNNLYNYQFSYPVGAEINFISSEDGKISIGLADTIGLKFRDGEMIRFQVLSKSDTVIPKESMVNKLVIGQNIFAYIKDSLNGIPCNYVIEGDKSYLCLYIRLNPTELNKDTQIQKVLESIKFF